MTEDTRKSETGLPKLRATWPHTTGKIKIGTQGQDNLLYTKTITAYQIKASTLPSRN